MMFSDCCGVEIVMDIADLELCPRCWEHCDVVFEDEDMRNAREDIAKMTIEEYHSLPIYGG
jgi:hypothetical protein